MPVIVPPVQVEPSLMLSTLSLSVRAPASSFTTPFWVPLTVTLAAPSIDSLPLCVPATVRLAPADSPLGLPCCVSTTTSPFKVPWTLAELWLPTITPELACTTALAFSPKLSCRVPAVEPLPAVIAPSITLPPR